MQNIENLSELQKEFVTFTPSLRLKALGFDEPCFAFYQEEYVEAFLIMVDDDEQYRLTGYRTCKNSEIPNHYVSAPTYSQAFRWFRENHNLLYQISFYREDKRTKKANWYKIDEWNEGLTKRSILSSYVCFKTYEEAELACLLKLIEIVEKRK